MNHARNAQRRRTLMVLDAENLIGPSLACPEAVAHRLAADLVAAADLMAEDQIVVGSDSSIGYPLGCAFPGRRLVVGRGKDGADNALLATIGSAHFIVERFGRVVIASGDGRAFTSLARQLRHAGVDVWVISRPRSLSSALAREAAVVLPYPTPETEAA